MLARRIAAIAARRFSSSPPILETKFCLFYEYVEDVVEKRVPFRQDHISLAKKFSDEGVLERGGAFADPVDGALVVFNDRGACDRFVAEDPYVLNGVVTKFHIREWSTVAL